MNQDELRAMLTAGIDAARNNNPILARQSFRQVLAEDPNNELAWMWLAQVVDLDDQRREALQNVLRINPDNDRARDALRRLGDDVPDPNQVQSRLSQALDSSSSPPPRAATPAPSQPPVFVPKKTDTRNQPRELWSSNRRGNDNNRLMFMLLVMLVGVLLIIAGLVIAITQIVDSPVTETSTPTEPVVADGNIDQPVPTNTPSGPTATFVVILETATPPSTLLPTAIPSETPIPTETPVPLPPDDDLTLLFLSDTGLASIRGDGSSERSVNLSAGGDSGSSLNINQAALSADGSSLVFSANVNGVQEIYTANANGSNAEQLTNLSASQSIDPAWSPDGRFVAFASDANGNLDIYVVSANGGIPRRVTSTPDDERQPVWSPDGKYLAYTVSPTSLETEIFVVEIGEISNLSQPLVEDNTSSDACQITRSTRSTYSPSFSPDGQRMAFVSNRDSATDTDVYIMNTDGTGVTLISLNDGRSQEQSVSWSPDGRWLAVTTTRTEAVMTESGFVNASGDSSGLIDDVTATPFIEPSATPDTADEIVDEDATSEPTEGDPDAQAEPTATPTSVPTSVPTSSDGEITTLWLYDIQAKLWYQVTDETATNVFWQPMGTASIEVSEDIKFNCMQ